MLNLKAADKVLLLIGVGTILVSGLLFFFISSSQQAKQRKSQIGNVITRTGDVRLKFASTQNWQSARYGQDLVYDDAIFAGENSSASIKIGNSTMEIGENSLVVLRKRDDSKVFDLTYGSMTAIIAEGEKVYLKNNDGKEIEVTTKRDSGFVIRRNQDGSLDVEVQSGEALSVVDGKKRKLESKQRLQVSERETKLVQPDLIITSDREKIYSNSSEIAQFHWQYAPPIKKIEDGIFRLEFSDSAGFQEITRKQIIRGKDKFKMRFKNSNRVFFRIRDRHQIVSNSKSFEYIRMRPPQFIAPEDEQVIYRHPQASTNLTLQFERPVKAEQVQIQVAKDLSFSDVVYDEAVWKNSQKLLFDTGTYYLRLKSLYAENHSSEWTAPRKISVLTPITQFEDVQLAQNITLPNSLNLESGDISGQQDELVQTLPELREFFAPIDTDKQVEVRFHRKKVKRSLGSNRFWPPRQLTPGRHVISYRLRLPGYRPSKWSKKKVVSVDLEPPIEIGKRLDIRSSTKWTQHTIEWTTLPLTPGYELKLAEEPEFELGETRNITDSKITLDVEAGKTYYWKVRPIAKSGKALSPFSEVYEFTILKSDLLLAKEMKAAKYKERYVAAAEDSEIDENGNIRQKTTDYVQTYRPPIRDHNRWVWLGLGFNYTTYSQSLPSVGKFSFSDSRANNHYFEFGYIGSKGYGGVLSYKNTPGKVELSNKSVENPTYSWSTISLEGQYIRQSNKRFLNTDFDLGASIGSQLHNLPFVEVDSSQNLFRRQVQMQTASLGVLSTFRRGSTKYYLSMRYQFPFSTRSLDAADFTISPQLAFDGTLGASHHFDSGLNIGWFWYGQLHRYDFKFIRDGVASEGFQSLFYSNMDLRLGYEF